jgi:hypothetical protein
MKAFVVIRFALFMKPESLRVGRMNRTSTPRRRARISAAMIPWVRDVGLLNVDARLGIPDRGELGAQDLGVVCAGVERTNFDEVRRVGGAPPGLRHHRGDREGKVAAKSGVRPSLVEILA